MPTPKKTTSSSNQRKFRNTVDGRNPAPVDRWFIPLFIGFQPSKVMQDFFHPPYHDGLVLDLCMTEGGVTYFKHGGWNDSVQTGHSTKPADRLPLGMVVSRGRLSPFMTASFRLVNYYIYSNLIFPDRCFSNINNDIWHWFSNLFFCHNSYPKRSNSKYEQC